MNPFQEFYRKYPELAGTTIRIHDGVPIFFDQDGNDITLDTVHPGTQLHRDLMVLTEQLENLMFGVVEAYTEDEN